MPVEFDGRPRILRQGSAIDYADGNRASDPCASSDYGDKDGRLASEVAAPIGICKQHSANIARESSHYHALLSFLTVRMAERKAD